MRSHTFIALLGAICGACYLGGAVPVERPAVGPAPLRRLSNNEYLNALHDLFPNLHASLPDLPREIPVAGFENAAESQEPSDVHVARYEDVANRYAKAAAANHDAVAQLTGCSDWATPTSASSCAAQFIKNTGGRVYRRPLSDEERERLVLRFQAWAAAVDFEGAVQLTLSAMLQAPNFLYRPEPVALGAASDRAVPVEPYAMASRLSFFLWESVPDDALLEAAANLALQTEEQIRAQAQRMLGDARARRVFWNFHRQWLGLDRILLDDHHVRLPAIDAAWTAATQQAGRMESELFVENVLSDGGTFRDLLTSRRAWVNSEMSRVYGLPAPQNAGAWTEVVLPENERAGILTRVSFLAGFSHSGGTSPPVRGNGIQLRLLCQLPVSPPPGADLSQPKSTPSDGPKTNRMLFEERTKPTGCQTCHTGLNGFGFGFESYNAAGHYQTMENGLAIDASGKIIGTDVDGPFQGGLGVSQALSRSKVVHQCATQQWVRYALGRAPVDIEKPMMTALGNAFFTSGGDIRRLLTEVVAAPTFRMRDAGEP